jgi:hypothetical protein
MNVRAAEQGEVAVQNKRFPHKPGDAASSANESYWSKLIPRNLTEIVLVALVVLVISLHLKYLLEVSTAVPHGDEWSLLDGMFRSLDEHRVGAWVFQPRNGHFLIPGTLAYLVSLRGFSLDLAPLKLLNFPICLAVFLLTAHVINVGVRSRFLRFYLHAGASFVIFNLCFWELFTMGYLFTAILSALFGGMGLYYIAKALQLSPKWKGNLLVGIVFLIASVLSLGAGYAAVAAAVLLLALCSLKKLAYARQIRGYETVVYCLVCALGLLAIASHPFFHLRLRIIRTVFHSVLVAGSAGASFVEKSSMLAWNVAFACGAILIIASLAIGFDFLTRRSPRGPFLPVFSLALVAFGLIGCIAVAVSRSYLPNGELLSSRYALYPSICLLGILLYFAQWRVFWLTHVWCFAAAGYLLATVKEQQVGFFRPALYQRVEVAIRNIDNFSDPQLRATLLWRENTQGVRRVTARMRRDQLNVFRGSPRANNPPH